MDKKSPYFTATTASIVYFIIYFTLKYFLAGRILDFKGALIGAAGFWIVIFIVHKILARRHSE